ncbi:hypothetical protein HDU93_002598 [Gonapodya sp. JEL0774]|nr:hypothetical protein HDU93_002598 [Gonapodya sp. JEL0774]
MDKATSLYRCAAQAADTAAQLAGGKLVVAWVGMNSQGQISMTDSDYKEKMLLDSGAAPIILTTPTADTSSLLAVDVLIDETPGVSTLADVMRVYGFKDSDTSRFRFLANKRVYRTDGMRNLAGADDFDQSRLAMPEDLQQDLAHVFYPAMNPTWRRMWLRNVATAELSSNITSSLCPAGNFSSTFIDARQNITCVETSVSILSTPSGVAKIFAPIAAGLLLIIIAAIAAWWYYRRNKTERERRRTERAARKKDYMKSRSRRPMSPVGKSSEPLAQAAEYVDDETERKPWLRMEEINSAPEGSSSSALESARSRVRGFSQDHAERDLGETGYGAGSEWRPAQLAAAPAAEAAPRTSGIRSTRTRRTMSNAGEREVWGALGSDSEVDDPSTGVLSSHGRSGSHTISSVQIWPGVGSSRN